MHDHREIQRQIEPLVRRYFSALDEPFIPGKSRIPIAVPSYGADEVLEALDSLLSTWVTMGRKVADFERRFSGFMGMPHGLMVNSGSSANLIALSILRSPLLREPLLPGDEVITPACTWSTAVFPLAMVNATPVIVDVNVGTYDMIVSEVEKALSDKTRAIMPVHLLGGVCDMKPLMELAERHGLYVIEDACESYGAEYHGKKVGSFGDLSTASFFFSHHITTIEGGMVLTRDEQMLDIGKALRAYGWVRDMAAKERIMADHPHIDGRFLFYTTGFNMRPTELQGAFGIQQMQKIEQCIRRRRDNFEFFRRELESFSESLILHEEMAGTRMSSFCYPITVRPGAPFTKERMVRFLEQKGIETRPIQSGNILRHPAMSHVPHRAVGSLPNAAMILERGFFFGNHDGIGREQREYIVDCITEFMKTVQRGGA